ncbi:MAG: hypothetical protein PG977_000564 [Bartonella clarridgeiae]|nr:MAG: hypothetical protein PG977_000564 [Bartonella clarridgeiae]
MIKELILTSFHNQLSEKAKENAKAVKKLEEAKHSSLPYLISMKQK